MDRGASIARAPAASMRWGLGSALHGRLAELWRRGANIGLGSNSPNWSNAFDLGRKAGIAVLTARDVAMDRTHLVAEEGLLLATRAGARWAGLAHNVGSLEPGKRADIVIHTLDLPQMMPSTNMVRNLFYAARSKSVHTMIIDGKVVPEAGRFTALDEREIFRTIRAASVDLFRRMGRAVEANSFARAPRRPRRP
jgi:5-methylthioadenosine/S-adenosylhomocysteine deaminase